MYQILHVASWFPSREHPTLGNFVERHIEAISKVHTGYVLYATKSNVDEIVQEEKEGYTVVRVYFRKKSPLLSQRKALQKGWKIIQEQGFKPACKGTCGCVQLMPRDAREHEKEGSSAAIRRRR